MLQTELEAFQELLRVIVVHKCSLMPELPDTSSVHQVKFIRAQKPVYVIFYMWPHHPFYFLVRFIFKGDDGSVRPWSTCNTNVCVFWVSIILLCTVPEWWSHRNVQRSSDEVEHPPRLSPPLSNISKELKDKQLRNYDKGDGQMEKLGCVDKEKYKEAKTVIDWGQKGNSGQL